MPEDRTPDAPEAERVVLGLMMLDGSAALEAVSLLSTDDFHRPAYRHTFRAMAAIAERGEDLNPIAVGEELRREGALEQAGGFQSLSELTYGVPHFNNVAAYARLLRDKAVKRQIIRVADKMAAEAREDDEPAPALISKLEEYAGELARESADQRPGRPLSLAERKHLQLRRHELFFRGVSNAVPTGFDEIDSRLTGGGLLPKQFVILAARPSVGKSSLALDFAANVAGAGRGVLMFSLEMGAEALTERLESFSSGLERWKIRPGIYESDYRRLLSALDEVSTLPLWIDDTSRTISAIRRHARDLCRRPETRPRLIIVDYLQLVDSEQRRGSRNDDVGSVSRALKGLAMELDLPVLALSQLSRDCEKQNREPELSDLRDSGELEQDADTVLFLYGNRPEEGARYYERTLKCAKQREGALFRTELIFNGSLVSFRTYPYGERENPEVPFGLN